MKNEQTIAWALFKTFVFTLIVPGTVGVFIPRWIILANGGSPSFPHVWWRWIGSVPLVAGFCVYLICAWDFAVSGLGTPAPIDMPRKLVVKGLYRFVRNPMYLGVTSFVIGQALVFRSGAVLLYIACVWVLFNLFVIFHEEPALHRKFGEEYEEYCRRVPRWLPRVGR